MHPARVKARNINIYMQNNCDDSNDESQTKHKKPVERTLTLKLEISNYECEKLGLEKNILLLADLFFPHICSQQNSAKILS